MSETALEEANEEFSGIARLYTSRAWARISLIATLIAVFTIPGAAIGAMLTGQAVSDWVHAGLYIEAVVSLVFALDLVIGYAARGKEYLKDPVHWINWLAIIAVGLQLSLNLAGIANAEILRILTTARAVAKLGLLSRGTIDESPLGAEAVRRMNEQDIWFSLALLLLLSGTGRLSLGNYSDIWAPITEIIVYAGFIAIIRWKNQRNRHHVEDVFLNRIRNANEKVLGRMQEIPGLENSEKLIEERAEERSAEGKPTTEIEVMVEAISIIISNLRRFISNRTFAEARGEEVLSPERPVALMFTDVENFSKVTQAMKQSVIPVMKQYMGEMSERVFSHFGDVDKFIGDAVFAYFDDAENPDNTANLAYDAALAMQAQCQWLAQASTEWSELFDGDPAWDQYREFRTRIGLHMGHVVAGPIGSDRRADSTLLGDDVNISARLEALCKQYQAYYLMSEGFYESLSEDRKAHCRWIDRVAVAGREAAPLNVYTIDEREFPEAFHQHFNTARDAYLDGEWQTAFEEYEAAQQVLRNAGEEPDPVSDAMQTRIDGNLQFWFRAIDHMRHRAPDIITEEIEAELRARRDELPHHAPVTWKGYWTHTK